LTLIFYRVLDFDNPDEMCWYTGEECVVKYTVETNAGLYLSQWDYIMLYKVRLVTRLYTIDLLTSIFLTLGKFHIP